MPRKIRDLIHDLEKAGFINRGGKGSHRNFRRGDQTLTISGNPGDDAHTYQERQVKNLIGKGKP